MAAAKELEGLKTALTPRYQGHFGLAVELFK